MKKDRAINIEYITTNGKGIILDDYLNDDKSAVDKEKIKKLSNSKRRELVDTIRAKMNIEDYDILKSKHKEAKDKYASDYTTKIKGTEDLKGIFDKDGDVMEFDSIDKTKISTAIESIKNE